MVYCGFIFVFTCKVLVCLAVGLYLCFPYSLSMMCCWFIFVFVYSFSVACCWFSRIAQSDRSISIIGHADPCVVSPSG